MLTFALAGVKTTTVMETDSIFAKLAIIDDKGF